MLKDITLGQYFPKESPIHHMDARVKILLALACMIIILMINGIPGYIALGGVILVAVVLSEVPMKTFVKSLKPIMIFLVFTLFLNIFLTPGTTFFKIGFIHATYEGLYYAAIGFCRIVFMVLVSSLLTYTTSPIVLTNAIERLLSPLKIVKFPSHEVAMMMTIALRFIPTLLEEADKIMKAQMARCADFESGNIVRRIKALIPLLVPLFVSAFRRADELAVAMESRCYRGGEGRTSFKILKTSYRDYIAISIVTMVSSVIVWMGM